MIATESNADDSNLGAGCLSDVISLASTNEQQCDKDLYSGTLRPLTKIYGREEEIDVIHSEYCRVKTNSDSDTASLVLIQGPSGVGKTSLAKNILQDRVRDDGGFFVTWKFDPLVTLEVCDGFEETFEDLCHQIMQCSLERRLELRNQILAAGPTDCAMLLKLIPRLKEVIGDEYATDCCKTVVSAGKHFEVILSFLNCLGKSDHPLVFLLDDLEFSDPSTLLIVSQLILSLNTSGTLCMATIGPQPTVGGGHGVDKMVRGFTDENIRVTNIVLKDLDEDTVNSMVADMLHVDMDASASMAKVLYHYSRANPRFLIELLRFMVEASVIKYDDDTNSWNCEEPQEEFLSHCCNLESLMAYKISLFPQELQQTLKVASCFGTNVDVSLIQIVIDTPHEQLKAAAELGLVVPVDEFKGSYSFAHSAVRRGAYALMLDHERQSLHLEIGMKLWKTLDVGQLVKHLPVVLGQIKFGVTCLEDGKERYDVAKLCLKAARTALDWSGFGVAFECLEFGISLLSENCWRDQYDLTLALHNNAAECGHTIGNFDRALELVDVVLLNARTFDDEVQAHCTQLYILSSNHEIVKTLEVGVTVLSRLGVSLPVDPRPRDVKRETARMRKFMKGKTPETLLRLPIMTDRRMASAIQVINLIFCGAFLARPNLATLLAIHGMRITATHGLCAVSSYIFGMYGSFLCTCLDNLDEGTRYGDAALQLLDRFKAQEWAPRVYVVVYGNIYGWSKDLRHCVEQLGQGQRMGFRTGDNQFAILNGNLRAAHLIALGEPLASIKQGLDTYSRALEALNQTSMLNLQRQFTYMVTTLMESNDSPEYLEQVRMEARHLDKQPSVGVFWDWWVLFQMSLVAYFLQDYALATELADKSTVMDSFPFKTVDVALFYLHCGLCHIAKYRVSGRNKRKALKVARRRLKQLELFAKKKPKLNLGKVYLLKAEIAAVTNQRDETYNHYVVAAACFSDENLLMELAITKELIGRFMIQRGNHDLARTYIAEAIELFSTWGALGKTQLLKREFARVSIMEALSSTTDSK